MCKSPLVSVIIPAYNASAFIRQTLDSVLSQTYKNIEVIVVDDGSQDQTPQIVESVAESDNRVILLRRSNKGVAAARNLAIEKSSGEYVAPIDADDIWHPQKIEKQVRCMLEGGPSVGLVYCWWVSINKQGSPIYTSPKWHMEGAVYEALISLNFIGNASVPLIRRACIERVGGYNNQLREQGGQGCEDWDLSLRIAEYYQFRLVPEYLVGYRSVKESMAQDFTAMKRSHDLMIENVKQRHSEFPNEIYRWSKSHFYLYLAGVSYKSCNYRGALHWVYRAFCSDQVAILSPWMVKMIATSLPKIAANLITSFIRPNGCAWLNSRQCSSFRNQESAVLSELEKYSKSKPPQPKNSRNSPCG